MNGIIGKDVETITLHDTNEQPKFKAIQALTTGVIIVTNRAGVDVTVPIAANQIIACQFKIMKSTGTTATGLIGYY